MTPRGFIDARGLLSEVVHRRGRGRPPDRVVASVSSGMSKEVTVQGRGVQDGTILPFSNKFQRSEGHGRRLATIFNGALGEKDGEPPRGPGRVSWVHTPPDVTPAASLPSPSPPQALAGSPDAEQRAPPTGPPRASPGHMGFVVPLLKQLFPDYTNAHPVEKERNPHMLRSLFILFV